MFTYDESIDPEFVGGSFAWSVEVSKVGGGTVGREYVGAWQYRACLNGVEVARGADFTSGMPMTHHRVAREVWSLLREDA